MDIRLIVLRTPNMLALADFYRVPGLVFEHHTHGNSPLHYSTTIGHTVLEIYPLAKNQLEADKNLRVRFGIDNFDATVERLRTNNIVFSTAPMQTDFGFMAVVVDPDGRKIELYKK